MAGRVWTADSQGQDDAGNCFTALPSFHMLKLASGYEIDIFSSSRFLLIPHMHREIIAEAFFNSLLVHTNSRLKCASNITDHA